MKIIATPLVVGAGIAITSDDQSITVMLRPGEIHTVSDIMRSSKGVRDAITRGYITVVIDATISDSLSATHSDFVAQVELNALAAFVSGVSGMFSSFSGFSGSTGVQGTKYAFLDIHGAADLDEILKVSGTPYLNFHPNKTGKSAWTWTVPEDYVAGTPVIVELYWSPSLTGAGNVKWILEYKSIAPGSSVAGALLTSTLIQPSPGTMANLTTTGTSLTVPGGATTANDLLTISIMRDGKDALDTFTGYAWLHLVRISYTGMKFST